MKVLDPYRKVKALLVDNGYEELKDVEIYELTENEKSCDTYAGYCKSNAIQDKQVCVNDNYILVPVKAKYVKVRIRKNGELLEPSLVLPTLLHEFAHCITDVERKRDPKTKKWKNHYHEEKFYEAYANILRTAEELKIYKLTYAKDKRLSMRSLKRFDDIYLMHDGVISTGYSEMFPDKKTKNIINVMVHLPKGPRVVTFNNSVDSIYALVKTKGNIKKKNFKLIDKDGNEINPRKLKTDDKLWIRY